MSTWPRTTTTTHAGPLLLPTLCVVVMTVSVLQTMVVPIIGTIGQQLDVSTTAAGWVLTANLLAAVVATPVIGRLADLHGKRQVLLSVLALVLIGSLIAAATDSLALLLAGRVLQGVSYALFPISLALLRDEMPRTKLVGSMAVVSGTLSVGAGLGLILTGVLTSDGADYHRVFWLTVAILAVAILLCWVAVPARPRVEGGRVDWLGAFLLGTALVLLFLALTQGRTWGWVSVPTLGCAVGGFFVLTVWWVSQNRIAVPLVAPRMLTHGPLLATNIATLFVGIAMFLNFLACSYFVQTPSEIAGYGFSADVLSASLVYLLPGAALGALTSLIAGRLINRFGARAVLIGGSGLGTAGFVFFDVAGDHGVRRRQRLRQPGVRRRSEPADGRGIGERHRGGQQRQLHRPHRRHLDRQCRTHHHARHVHDRGNIHSAGGRVHRRVRLRRRVMRDRDAVDGRRYAHVSGNT